MEIQLRSSSPLIVGCFYRPPDSQVSAFSDSLDLSFSRLDISRTKVLLVGDFNAKSPSWLSSDCYNAAGLILEPLFLQLGLQQCVSSPTHLSQDGTPGSLLDLALASSPTLVSSVDTHPPLGSSDHLLVFCQLDVHVDRVQRSQGRTIWNYDTADFNLINKVLGSADWSSSLVAADIDSTWSSWQSTFLQSIHNHISSKVIKNFKPKNPYVTPAIAKAIKDKRAAFRLFKKQPSTINREDFKQKRNLVTHLLRKSERAHAATLHRSLRLSPSISSSRDFWQHMKLVQGKVKHTVIPDLIIPASSSVAHLPADKARTLNSFFCQ